MDLGIQQGPNKQLLNEMFINDMTLKHISLG